MNNSRYVPIVRQTGDAHNFVIFNFLFFFRCSREGTWRSFVLELHVYSGGTLFQNSIIFWKEGPFTVSICAKYRSICMLCFTYFVFMVMVK
jgi:hypothetical protein